MDTEKEYSYLAIMPCSLTLIETDMGHGVHRTLTLEEAAEFMEESACEIENILDDFLFKGTYSVARRFGTNSLSASEGVIHEVIRGWLEKREEENAIARTA